MKCEICGKEFATFENLIVHMNTNYGEMGTKNYHKDCYDKECVCNFIKNEQETPPQVELPSQEAKEGDVSKFVKYCQEQSPELLIPLGNLYEHWVEKAEKEQEAYYLEQIRKPDPIPQEAQPTPEKPEEKKSLGKLLTSPGWTPQLPTEPEQEQEVEEIEPLEAQYTLTDKKVDELVRVVNRLAKESRLKKETK